MGSKLFKNIDLLFSAVRVPVPSTNMTYPLAS